MKRTFTIICLFAFDIILSNNAQCQTLLSPGELIKIQMASDSVSITALLKSKDYEPWSCQIFSDEKVYTWTLKNSRKNIADYAVNIYSYKAGQHSISYDIPNKQDHQKFINNLMDDNYKFCGIKIINKRRYSVFKHGKYSLLICPVKYDGSYDTSYEIRVE